MFEEDMEMEKKNSPIVPVAMVLLLLGTIGYGIFYLITDSQRKMTAEQATPLAQMIVASMKPPTIEFHTGTVEYSSKENPADPHFAILAKAGLLSAKAVGRPGAKSMVAVTPKGEATLAQIPGVKKSEDKDKTMDYVVPLSGRKFVAVTNVTMQGSTHALVEFTWLWDANEVGKILDANGPLVKGFGTWDRQKLIDKYGAKFYSSTAPQSGRFTAEFSRDKGWQIAQ